MEDEGSLRDIAPTMLGLLGLNIPTEMTGQPLVHIGQRRDSKLSRGVSADNSTNNPTDNAVG